MLANKCWVVGCASLVKRQRPAILARCLMLMNAQSWSNESHCAVGLFGIVAVDRFEFLKQMVTPVGLGQGVPPHLMSVVFGSIVQEESE